MGPVMSGIASVARGGAHFGGKFEYFVMRFERAFGE